MKTSLLKSLVAAAALSTVVFTASAQISAHFDFDGLPSGSLASAFNIPQISFHQAAFLPRTDGFGDPIAGTEHWQIDTLNDGLFPLTVEDPLFYDRGPAPSGTNALQALFQPVVLWFDQSYALQSFSVTLDNDPFGFPEQIAFVSSTGILGLLTIDQSVPGLTASAGLLPAIRGIVLPAGALYDNLSVSLVPVPEPVTYGLVAALGLVAIAVVRRYRRALT